MQMDRKKEENTIFRAKSSMHPCICHIRREGEGRAQRICHIRREGEGERGVNQQVDGSRKSRATPSGCRNSRAEGAVTVADGGQAECAGHATPCRRGRPCERWGKGGGRPPGSPALLLPAEGTRERKGREPERNGWEAGERDIFPGTNQGNDTCYPTVKQRWR